MVFVIIHPNVVPLYHYEVIYLMLQHKGGITDIKPGSWNKYTLLLMAYSLKTATWPTSDGSHAENTVSDQLHDDALQQIIHN